MTSRNQRKKRTNQKKSVAARSEQARTAGSSDGPQVATVDRAPRSRSSVETKSALKTTELAAYVLTVLAIVMTALALDADGDGGRDPFGAESAIRYITYLTVGYMIARGLAKAGSWSTRARRTVDHAPVAPARVVEHDLDDVPDVTATPERSDHVERVEHVEKVEQVTHAEHADDVERVEHPASAGPTGDDQPQQSHPTEVDLTSTDDGDRVQRAGSPS